MNVPKFTASIFARGAITIKGLRADATRLSVPGAGRISATGDLGQLDVAMGGQGAIDTRTANARSVNVSLAGKGVIAVSVDGPASGNLAGAGTVAVVESGLRNPQFWARTDHLSRCIMRKERRVKRFLTAMMLGIGMPAWSAAPKPMLMIVGTPHFANPSRDIANTKVEVC
jgi:hypothetical protein